MSVERLEQLAESLAGYAESYDQHILVAVRDGRPEEAAALSIKSEVYRDVAAQVRNALRA